MQEQAVRWNIKVSKETDLTLRTFLGSQGMKKGDLSKFIEQAVRAHVFHRTVQDIKARNADTDPGELQTLIHKTVREVRAERREEHPRSFRRFEVRHIVRGKGISAKAVEHAVQLSTDKYCGVAATVRPTAEIVTSFEIQQEPEEERVP